MGSPNLSFMIPENRVPNSPSLRVFFGDPLEGAVSVSYIIFLI